MNKLLNAFINMRMLDEESEKETFIHHLHPLNKMIGCVGMLICILTSSNIIELLLYFLLIVGIGLLAQIKIKKLLSRSLIGLPFSFCLGLSFLLFNHQTINYYGLMMSQGAVSFILVMSKTALCLMVTYVLICTTSFDVIVSELIHIKVPSLLVLELTMTYRYIFTFLEMAQSQSVAYSLRNPEVKGIRLKDMGSFVGHLLINSMEESQSVYDCMKCRGFDISYSYQDCVKYETNDLCLLMMMVSLMVVVKVML